MTTENLIKKFCPDFKDVGCFFKKYLQQYITNDSTILDIGCGRQSFGEKYYKIAKHKIGIDPDQDALRDNNLMDEKLCCTIQKIPDTIGQFDIIIAQWVLEHMQCPDEDIRIIGNLCKKNGYFIFMTTNIYSPIILLSKIIPTFLKKYLRKVLLKINEEDTYPTVYKINSIAKIDHYLSINGFKKVEVKKVGVLTYFAWNKYILLCKIFFDRTIGRLNFPKTHIVGIYKKIN
jgi:2-polyprenyl-3-methyl-5-hydroxy-6-metoxy-1,4-benzoquinol methylase